MTIQAFPGVNSQKNLVEIQTRILGTGAAAPTKVYGNGVTVSRTSEGLYKYTFAANPGKFIGFSHGFQAATPSAMAGHTATADTMSTSSPWHIEVLVTDAANAVDDLDANEWLSVTFQFERG